MRHPVFGFLAAGLCALGVAQASADEGAGAAVATTAMGNAAAWHHGGGDWNRQVRGRWYAGWNAPGGWAAYRRPSVGWALPRYWINPVFYVADYRVYALPAPAYGFGWSRYYDDAVLTDRWGRVVDVRYGYDWNGDRRSDRHHDHKDRYTDRYSDDVVTVGGRPVGYSGHWQGTWYGDDGSVYSGTYEGGYDGYADARPPVSAGPALPYRPMSAYGYSVGGQYYEGGAGRVVYREVDYAAPIVTTTVTEETTYQSVRKAVKRKAPVKRRYVRPACSCSCVCK